MADMIQMDSSAFFLKDHLYVHADLQDSSQLLTETLHSQILVSKSAGRKLDLKVYVKCLQEKEAKFFRVNLYPCLNSAL